ncbi:hypothetical protein ABZ614_07830 [Streptomyces sp. NPDC013178]|uniref:hypothetical protein n=1 Tax=Streptomyces sp. NPDC013178 TaxID=3155118 RepID=UPI0033C24EAE
MDSGGNNKLEDDDKRMVRNVMSGEYNPTDLSVSYESSPSWSGDAETDIYYSEGTVSGSDEGLTYCENPRGLRHLQVRPAVREDRARSLGYGLTCHETGHAVGLLHGDDSMPTEGMRDSRLGCMKKNSTVRRLPARLDGDALDEAIGSFLRAPAPVGALPKRHLRRRTGR